MKSNALSGPSEASRARAEPAVRSQGCRVLMLYLEPAPYIVGLVDRLRGAWDGPLDVAYVEMNRSQPWDYRTQSDTEIVLPNGTTAAIRALRRRIASGRYGLLHLAGWGHPVLVAATLMARLYGMPVTMESDTPRRPEKTTWKTLVKRMMYPWLFSIPKLFLPGGTRQAAYLTDYGVGETRIRVAQMTVDVGRIRAHADGRKAALRAAFRSRLDIPADAVVVLYLGRLEPHKGIDDLLQAYARAAPERPDLYLLIVGDGSLRSDIEAAAAASRTISYAGRLSGEDVWDAYCAADIFVLPSREEPWGLVVNEAMAAGLPVIVTDRVGCADDIVRDNVTGLVVPADAPRSLAEAIARLADSPSLRQTMGQAGEALIAGWTIENQAVRTTAAWRQALA